MIPAHSNTPHRALKYLSCCADASLKNPDQLAASAPHFVARKAGAALNANIEDPVD